MKPRKHIVSLIVVALSATSQAQTTLFWGGGTTDITNDTTVPMTQAGLAGTWDLVTKNWANDPLAPNTYQVWVNGSIANFGIYDTASSVAISQVEDVTISGIRANSAGNGFNLVYTLNDTTPRVITLNPNTTFSIEGRNNTNGFQVSGNVSLAGNSGFTKDGSGVFTISSNSNALTGEVAIRSGNVNVGGSGRLVGITSFDLAGYPPNAALVGLGGNEGFTVPLLNVGGSDVANNQLADEAEILLQRGVFQYVNGGASSTETIGRIVINGAGKMTLNQGNAAGVLTLSDATQGLSRGAAGRGTLVVGVPGSTDEVPRTNLQITNPGSIPVDTLLPWATTSRGEFMLIDSSNSNTLTRVPSTQGVVDLSTWSSTYTAATNVRLSNPIPPGPYTAGQVIGTILSNSVGNGDLNLATTVSINTLAFVDNATTTRNAGNTGFGSQTGWILDIEADDTLSLASGAIAQRGENNITNRIAGGSLTTPNSQLHLTTLDNISGNMELNTNITGTFDLIKSGITQITLGGSAPNTFVGNAYVNEGHLVLNKAGALNGNLILASGGSASLGSSSALSATSNVFVPSASRLNLSGSAVVGGVVTIEGGSVLFPNMEPVFNNAGTGLAFNGGTITQNSSATGILNLRTNVSYAAGSTKQAVFQKLNPAGAFNIELDGAERTFAIANSNTLAAGVAEMVVDTAITNGSGTGSLRKSGAGILELTGINTFTGDTVVEEGTLRLSTRSAAAQSGLVGTPGGGASAHILSLRRPIANSFLVGQTITGLNSSRRVVGIQNDYDVIMDSSATQGIISGISVNALSRTGSLAGNVTVENGGTLDVSAGSVVAGAVAVNNGGTLSGVVTLDSTLAFAAGSKLAVNLGTSSGGVTFSNLADSVSGSGLATLQITPAAGFSYGSTYIILSNVTTAGFTFGSIIGYDTVNYTASLAKSGDNYVLSFTATSGSPYDTWAAGFPGFTPTDSMLDFDNDGVANLLEFVFGGDPRSNDSPSIRPAVVASGANLVVTFKRSDASEAQPVTVKVQVSADLVTWNPADDIIIGASNGSGPNGATYTVDDAGDVDTIVVTIPKASAAKKFVRVVATD